MARLARTISGAQSCRAAASGKSHLAAVWRNVSDAITLTSVDEAEVSHQDKQNFVIDNPEPGERWNEEGLFHLFNLCADTGGSLLFLTHEPLAQMTWQLPDLVSRFRSCNMTRLKAPDDALCGRCWKSILLIVSLSSTRLCWITWCPGWSEVLLLFRR